MSNPGRSDFSNGILPPNAKREVACEINSDRITERYLLKDRGSIKPSELGGLTRKPELRKNCAEWREGRRSNSRKHEGEEAIMQMP